MIKRCIILSGLLVVVFAGGYWCGAKRAPTPGSFHDMIVTHPHELTALITPKDKQVRALAAELKTPEKAYEYVRDRIANDPAMPAVSAAEIVAERRGSCLGKAILLSSLYRALGAPASAVRVVTGEVANPTGIVDHAWVEIEYKGRCLQQDPTNLLGRFGFDQFPGMAYTQVFIRDEETVFNDTHFAVVSQLNQMKGAGHPPLH